MIIRQHPPARHLTSGVDPDRAWSKAPCTDLTQSFLWDLDLDSNGDWPRESAKARRERHREAIHYCHQCPALALCAERIGQPGVTGVIAGRVVTG